MNFIGLINWLLSIILLLFHVNANAQRENKPDFQEPDLSWWAPDRFTKDTSAVAVIMMDAGDCVAEPRTGSKFTHFRRIKILKRAGLDEWGNLNVPIYEYRLSKFSCIVYNLENGKIVATKSETSYNITKDHSKITMTFLRAAFPSIKEGSVIEFKYTIKHGGFVTYAWDFQHKIPVERSEYELFFPGARGNVIALITGEYNMTYITVKERGMRRKYVIDDLPAFKAEPWMSDEKYFRSALRLESVWWGSSLFKFRDEYIKDRILRDGIFRDTLMMDTRVSIHSTLALAKDGMLEGNVMIKKSGYDAVKATEYIADHTDDDYLESQIRKDYWTVSKQSLTRKPTKMLMSNKDSLNDFILNYEVTIPGEVQVADSLIYVNPYLAFAEATNPFNSAERKYPIDFGSRRVQTETTVLRIPEGYKVKHVLEKVSFELPGKAAVFVVSSTITNQDVIITSQLRFNRILFSVDQYQLLREFFSRMVSKRSELVLFVKQ